MKMSWLKDIWTVLVNMSLLIVSSVRVGIAVCLLHHRVL